MAIVQRWLHVLEGGALACSECRRLNPGLGTPVFPPRPRRVFALSVLNFFSRSLTCTRPPNMDVPTHPVTHGLAEDDELSDEQIEMLLKQAEVRAREKDTSSALAQIPSALDIKLPRLNTPGLPAPYVQMNGEVARVDPSRLLDDQQRALANHIRKVEDPVAVKKRKIEVRHTLPHSTAYEENIPNLSP